MATWSGLLQLMYAAKEDQSGSQDNRGYTIDDALDCVGFGKFQWSLLLMSGVGFCIMCCHMTYHLIYLSSCYHCRADPDVAGHGPIDGRVASICIRTAGLTSPVMHVRW